MQLIVDWIVLYDLDNIAYGIPAFPFDVPGYILFAGLKAGPYYADTIRRAVP
jgi:hypothetical protein